MQLRHHAVTAATLIALCAGLLASGTPGQAQSPLHRAGLVVQYADDSAETRCVEFDEPEITGYELLRRSGLPLVIAPGSFGATVCKIGPQGCNYPSQSCFCQCEDINATCVYWISFVQVGGEWKYATLGASNTQVKDGDMQAWVWGAGKAEGATVTPPHMTFDEVCVAAQAEPTAPAINTPAAGTDPMPMSTPTQQADTDGNAGGLIAFGGIAVVLGAILLITSRRQTKGRSNGDRYDRA
jgi:hypothetical protein